MIVRELMSRRVEWTTSSTTLADAARRMRDSNIGCLPVGEGDIFIGILTEKGFTARATAEGLNPTTTTVNQIMTRSVIYCQECSSLGRADTYPSGTATCCFTSAALMPVSKRVR